MGRGTKMACWVLATLSVVVLAQAQPMPPIRPPVRPPRGQLRGYADLHVHPATHFAFGRNGADEGLFWGKPGMAFADGARTINADLKACAGSGDPNLVGSISHGTGADFDPVRHQTHQVMVASLDSITGFSHSRHGAPSFESWPHSRSLLHEQMHVTMLHRAWEGGLRLIVAAAVDAQLLTRVWQNGFNVGNTGMPQVDPRFDVESAKMQIAWIKQFVNANSSWMEIVRTSEEAKRAIQTGKLAVVLAVEMDSLTADQILDLVKNYDVRSAIPVHLADNPAFGGAAVYNDLFNTSTQYLTGHFFRVEGDPNLAARLSPDTSTLGNPGGFFGLINAKLPIALKRADYCRLGYECCPDIPPAGSAGTRDFPRLPHRGVPPPCVVASQGHKNATGLTPHEPDLIRLMKGGVIVDIVHMGEKTTEQALVVAERFNYPVMNSHSELRDEHKCADNERAMRFDHARRMAKLGGMLGLGTEGHTQPTLVLDEAGAPLLVRFTGQLHERTWNLHIARKGVIDQLRFEIRTGSDDLRKARTAYGWVELQNGQRHQFVLNADSGWGNNSTNTVQYDTDIRPQDLKAVGVHTTFGGGIGGDNWNMNRVVVSVRIDGKWTIVTSASGAPLVRFTGNRHDWSAAANVAQSAMLNTCTPELAVLAPDDPVARVAVTIKTGGDDLRGGNDNAWGILTFHDGRRHEFPLNKGVRWQNDSIVSVETTVPDGTKLRDLKSFTLKTNFTGGIGGDNWNVDRLIVQALADPVANWIREYNEALGILGGRGVAIGTDMNGLAPQFPYSLRKTRYPVDVARKHGIGGARDLPQDRLGSRTFDFSRDGVAHVGLVPDFWGTLADHPRGEQAVTSIFQSAGEFVEMWRMIEEASRKIP